MALNRQQLHLVHRYAALARLPDGAYRALLLAKSNCTSCADPQFDQRGFDLVMAALETVLFQRVEAGLVADPVGVDRFVRNEFHWRNRLRPADLVSRRQAHHIEELWSELCRELPEDKRNLGYLAAIIVKATGKRNVGWESLTQTEASHLIDALTDRLAHNTRHNPPHMADPRTIPAGRCTPAHRPRLPASRSRLPSSEGQGVGSAATQQELFI